MDGGEEGSEEMERKARNIEADFISGISQLGFRICEDGHGVETYPEKESWVFRNRILKRIERRVDMWETSWL